MCAHWWIWFVIMPKPQSARPNTATRPPHAVSSGTGPQAASTGSGHEGDVTVGVDEAAAQEVVRD